MFVRDSTAELWSDSTVTCVLVPHGHQVAVELRNAGGSAFLRKTVPTRQAAVNEAEYLRLLLRPAGRATPTRGLYEALRAEGCAADAVLTKPYQVDTLIAAAPVFVRHLAGGADVTS